MLRTLSTQSHSADVALRRSPAFWQDGQAVALMAMTMAAACRALNPKEAVSAEQALLATTIRAAELGGLQDSLGSIRHAAHAALPRH